MNAKIQALLLVGVVSALSITGVFAATNLANSTNAKVDSKNAPIVVTNGVLQPVKGDQVQFITTNAKDVAQNGKHGAVTVTGGEAMPGWDANLTQEQKDLSARIPAAMEEIMADMDINKPYTGEEVQALLAKKLGVAPEKLDGIFGVIETSDATQLPDITNLVK